MRRDGDVSAVAHGNDVRASDGHEIWIDSPGSPAMKAIGENPGDIPNVCDSEYEGIVGIQEMQHGGPSIQPAERERNPGGREARKCHANRSARRSEMRGAGEAGVKGG